MIFDKCLTIHIPAQDIIQYIAQASASSSFLITDKRSLANPLYKDIVVPSIFKQHWVIKPFNFYVPKSKSLNYFLFFPTIPMTEVNKTFKRVKQKLSEAPTQAQVNLFLPPKCICEALYELQTLKTSNIILVENSMLSHINFTLLHRKEKK